MAMLPVEGVPIACDQRPNHALQQTRRCRLGRFHGFGSAVDELGSLGRVASVHWFISGLFESFGVVLISVYRRRFG